MTSFQSDFESLASEPKPSDSLRLRVRETMLRFRLPLLVIAHLTVFAAVYWVAFLMRFTLKVPVGYVEIFWQGLPIILAIKTAVFYGLGSIHGWWRHVSFSDIISLAKSTAVASLIIVALDHFVLQTWQPQIPRTVVLNDFVLTIVVLGGLRSCWRLWDERIAPMDRNRTVERALLVGNNYHAARLAHLINGQHQLETRVVGLVSPTEYARGRRYSDMRVVGKVEDLPALMKHYRVKSLFVATGSLHGRELRDLLDSSTELGFKIRILPPLEDHLRGADRVPIREVSYNDLLRRKPVELDLDSIEKLVAGKTILVTGAGGSIGSELCRQLSRYEPAQIVLLGRGENRIYHIERELRSLAPHIELIPKIVNITDADRIRQVFSDVRPDLVFHAAAHKHVPLVELNIGEGIINNILGTKTVADMACAFGVERFVMVSTDKSVNPTSIMGCTKQMAERYCQALDGESQTRFISTRFGNVLGSAGSVVPLFQDQISRGGPITITDRRMTRYFMTIPEASQLVIQAAAMGAGGEIFVLEMGEPVKIIDLANDLVRLAGHSEGSIEIVETGVRPGEKLYEELYYENEQSIPTAHDKILSSYSRMFDLEEVEQQVQRLVNAAFESPGVIKGIFKEVIPEFDVQNIEQADASRLG